MKKFRQISSALLVVCLLATLFTSSIFAANPEQYTIVVPSVIKNTADSFVVEIHTGGMIESNAVSYTVLFDRDAFSVAWDTDWVNALKAETGHTIGGGTIGVSGTSGRATMNLTGGGSHSTARTVYGKLVFSILPGAATAATPLQITMNTLDPATYAVNAAAPATITLSAPQVISAVAPVTAAADKKVSNGTYTAADFGLTDSTTTTVTASGATPDPTVGTENWALQAGFSGTSVAAQTASADLVLDTATYPLLENAATPVKATSTITLLPATYNATASADAVAALVADIDVITDEMVADETADTVALINDFLATKTSVTLKYDGELSTDEFTSANTITWDTVVAADIEDKEDGDTIVVNGTIVASAANVTNGSATISVSIPVVAGTKYKIASFEGVYAIENGTVKYTADAPLEQSVLNSTNASLWVKALCDIDGAAAGTAQVAIWLPATFATNASAKAVGDTFDAAMTSVLADWAAYNVIENNAAAISVPVLVTAGTEYYKWNTAPTRSVAGGFVVATIAANSIVENLDSELAGDPAYASAPIIAVFTAKSGDAVVGIMAMEIKDKTTAYTASFGTNANVTVTVQLYSQHTYTATDIGKVLSPAAVLAP